MRELHIDIETYSSIDIKSCGAYRYFEALDFEILLIAYAFDHDPVEIIDLAKGDQIPFEVSKALKSPLVKKIAHNAAFERQAFKHYGIDTPLKSWECSAVHSAYCGLPLSLDMVSKALGLGDDKAKLASGKALIKYFCVPCKPTKVNGQRCRNFPEHDPEKWEEFKEYCIRDVEAEREIMDLLAGYSLTDFEKEIYYLDQKINDRGIIIDTDLASNAYRINKDHSTIVKKEIKALTGVENPNSVAQLKEWISSAIKKDVESLAKDKVIDLLQDVENGDVLGVLRLRQMLSKSSIKKYSAMLNCVCSDGRGHGFFQFYGANRTGRWAGRLVQLQNLTKNYLPDLDTARNAVKSGRFENVEILYGNVPDTLSQLIRTSFIAPEGKTFAIADFSAIEARVIAWLAEESWRLEVFKTHGKIYEASAAYMFSVDIESIDKGSDLRQKGKVAELALGYQGSTGALKTMGAEDMGLSEEEMKDIVIRWRQASPKIVQLWRDLEACAKRAIKLGRNTVVKSKHRGLEFSANSEALAIKLPSGRSLYYRSPQIRTKTVRKENGESWQAESIVYMGMDQVKKQWTRLDTYGGKLAENIVQAIARDVLADSMRRIDCVACPIVMHVHDEVVCEVPIENAEHDLGVLCEIMGQPIPWAPGLPLAADGYLSTYYKKD